MNEIFGSAVFVTIVKMDCKVGLRCFILATNVKPGEHIAGFDRHVVQFNVVAMQRYTFYNERLKGNKFVLAGLLQ